MSEYRCTIITPTGKIFDEHIDSLSATGRTGSFGILGHHAPMVIALSHGPMTIRQEMTQSFFAVSSGVLEVNGNSDVILLADSAMRVNTYDEAKATARPLT